MVRLSSNGKVQIIYKQLSSNVQMQIIYKQMTLTNFRLYFLPVSCLPWVEYSTIQYTIRITATTIDASSSKGLSKNVPPIVQTSTKTKKYVEIYTEAI